MIHFNSTDAYNSIAIIGMAGRFPKANNVNEYWENIKNGIECITFFDDNELIELGIDRELIKNPNYVKAKGIIENIELFDASFFGINPKDAELMDPQHRLLMECAWHALEDAGYDAIRYNGRIGVFAGQAMGSYFNENIFPYIANKQIGMATLQAAIGNDKDSITTSITYRMNLRGAGITIQSSSSTSLVAVVMACQSLLNYQCDMILAGGIAVNTNQKSGYVYEEGGIVSPDGHCRTFDQKAKGFVPGNGMGIVVLKRLDDALQDGDNIYAVVKGTAVNNDGSSKVSYSAPSVDAQSEVIAEAQALAGIHPETISYVEAHGTGTNLGDPIEIAALTKAFRQYTKKTNFCAIGSVKTNIGHLDTAAGVAGLMKTALSLKYKLILPSLHFESANPDIDFLGSPFYVNTKLQKWDTKNGIPRRAGVTSLGMGGTNAHVVLEEAPNINTDSSKYRDYKLLFFSAKTESALDQMIANTSEFLKNNPNISFEDVAYTLQVGRKELLYRKAVVCESAEDFINTINNLNTSKIKAYIAKDISWSITFMFSGQGSQYVNMARELYQTEDIFKSEIDNCINILKPILGFDLLDYLYPKDTSDENEDRLSTTLIAQPCIFIVEYAMAKLLIHWGIKPQSMIGHSVGEYVAACLSGVFSLEDALSLVASRAKLMNDLPRGAMTSVVINEEKLREIITPGVDIATVNSPLICVVSGEFEHIQNFESILDIHKIKYTRIKTSHAFHSRMMEPILDKFGQCVQKINMHEPNEPYLSGFTGRWIKKYEPTDWRYWVNHLRNTVRFNDGIQELESDPNRIFVEVGAGNTLYTFVKQQIKDRVDQFAGTSIRHPQKIQSDTEHLYALLSDLWIRGVNINWENFYSGEKRKRVSLPTYPFEGKRYWMEKYNFTQEREYPYTAVKIDNNIANCENNIEVNEENSCSVNSDIKKRITGIWEDLLGISSISPDDDFFELGGHSIIATQIVSQIRNTFNIDMQLSYFYLEPSIRGNLAYILENISVMED